MNFQLISWTVLELLWGSYQSKSNLDKNNLVKRYPSEMVKHMQYQWLWIPGFLGIVFLILVPCSHLSKVAPGTNNWSFKDKSSLKLLSLSLLLKMYLFFSVHMHSLVWNSKEHHIYTALLVIISHFYFHFIITREIISLL